MNMYQTVLVDKDIEELLIALNRKVYFNGDGYPCISLKGKHTKIHRFVMGANPDGLETDHINRDKLDNRRENLRFVTGAENRKNRGAYSKSGKKHIYFDSHSFRKKPWKVSIRADGKTKNIGYYETREQAEQAVYLYLT